MPVRLSTLMRPAFPLSVDAFPALAVERFGTADDIDQSWRVFEPVASTLVDSFYATVDTSRHDRLVPQLDAVAPELRGIAYEGAGMGLMLLDSMLPGRARLARFLHGPGARYRGLVAIGAGLVLPRVPVPVGRFLARQDPFLRWLVMDGYGFHDGFFRWRAAVEAQHRPRAVRGYGRRAYDQGIGRSLWFATGANVERITATLARFPVDRRRDLWGGIGLACAYAAGVLDRLAIRTLADAAGPFASHMAVGAAVASTFRAQSGMPAPHTDLACAELWGAGAEQVAETARDASRRPVGPRLLPTYGQWREQLRQAWLRRPVAVLEPGRAA